MEDFYLLINKKMRALLFVFYFTVLWSSKCVEPVEWKTHPVRGLSQISTTFPVSTPTTNGEPEM